MYGSLLLCSCSTPTALGKVENMKLMPGCGYTAGTVCASHHNLTASQSAQTAFDIFPSQMYRFLIPLFQKQFPVSLKSTD